MTELRRLQQLEEENAQLKKNVADLSFDEQMLQDVLKKALRIARMCVLATDLTSFTGQIHCLIGLTADARAKGIRKHS
jgi:hypothetical protein